MLIQSTFYVIEALSFRPWVRLHRSAEVVCWKSGQVKCNLELSNNMLLLWSMHDFQDSFTFWCTQTGHIWWVPPVHRGRISYYYFGLKHMICVQGLHGHDDKIRIVLNKADMVDHQVLSLYLPGRCNFDDSVVRRWCGYMELWCGAWARYIHIQAHCSWDYLKGSSVLGIVSMEGEKKTWDSLA